MRVLRLKLVACDVGSTTSQLRAPQAKPKVFRRQNKIQGLSAALGRTRRKDASKREQAGFCGAIAEPSPAGRDTAGPLSRGVTGEVENGRPHATLCADHWASVIPNGPLLAFDGLSVNIELTKHGAPAAKHVELSEN